ncbi:hypothetical protein C6380_14360 [Pseudomonas syringae pv. actinidiae]|uniref:hypothetical protein n=1 Tax=Pseudomonas syringae TaxID=317 RepID=UPI000BB55FF2|nr:hypothetical protein [Pseudomonas syringae]PBK49577.1 hypothetical protein BUE61_22555 [Pseudomonas syringae pv. actinidiae]PBK54237.1 hypothetical protein BUE60_10360 [Pseudomonas syringae pv. actinidiae]RJX53479.1 hypothetical protein C6379_17505 [Pseudomonas syringae pv. actinidiae]RJX55597.1 hypothetical protein C6380_14360 [Pseudomonas syringae pv. actinidiae]RJX63845.1 hypothetical protein C6383_05025 [Pseudomonas syringae pv. actinidiae]
MSNFPEGSPFTYIYAQAGSEFMLELVLLRPKDSLQIMVRAENQKPADEDFMIGYEVEGAAILLNSKLRDSVVKVYGQEHIDRIDEIFSKAGMDRLFVLENLTEGWVPDMIESFEAIKDKQGERAVTATEQAEAIREAHLKMIPF